MAKSAIDEMIVDANETSYEIEINVATNGISTSIVESQVVPYDKIINITDFSPETTGETKYASSARAAKEIHDKISSIDIRVNKLEEDIANGGSGGGESGGGGSITIDAATSTTSRNAIQNQAITNYVNTQFGKVSKVLDWFEFDSTAGMIKAKHGLYSTGTISAGGKSEGSPSTPTGVITKAELQSSLQEEREISNRTFALITTVTDLKGIVSGINTRVTSLEENTGGGSGNNPSIEGLTKESIINALEYTPMDESKAVYYGDTVSSSDTRKLGYANGGPAIAFGKEGSNLFIQAVEREENENLDIEVLQKKGETNISDRIVTERAAENGDIKFDSLHIGDAILSWDSTAQMLKFNKGIYSIGAVSAGGAGTTYTYQFDNWSDWVWAKDENGNKLAIPTNTKLLDYALSARLGVLLNERVTKIEDNAPIGNLALNFGTIARKVGRGEVDNDTMANEVKLTEQAIENILYGRYNKVVGSGANKDVWNYSAYENTSEICIFLRQGNAVYDLKYNKSESTWTIADEA